MEILDAGKGPMLFRIASDRSGKGHVRLSAYIHCAS
jgi:hypothetical protein